MKTLVVKGRAPVDPECYAAGDMHVYTRGSEVYDVMLNQVCSPYNLCSRWVLVYQLNQLAVNCIAILGFFCYVF